MYVFGAVSMSKNETMPITTAAIKTTREGKRECTAVRVKSESRTCNLHGYGIADFRVEL